MSVCKVCLVIYIFINPAEDLIACHLKSATFATHSRKSSLAPYWQVKKQQAKRSPPQQVYIYWQYKYVQGEKSRTTPTKILVSPLIAAASLLSSRLSTSSLSSATRTSHASNSSSNDGGTTTTTTTTTSTLFHGFDTGYGPPHRARTHITQRDRPAESLARSRNGRGTDRQAEQTAPPRRSSSRSLGYARARRSSGSEFTRGGERGLYLRVAHALDTQPIAAILCDTRLRATCTRACHTELHA